MALEVSVKLVGRDLNKIELCLTGSSSGASDIDLVVVDPLENSYTINNFVPTEYGTVNSVPSSGLFITADMLYGETRDKLYDGAYRVDYTINEIGGGTVTGTKFVLFSNNAVQGFMDLMEKLPTSTTDSYPNARLKATYAREGIQAALEFYKIGNTDLARKHLLMSLDISETA